MKRSKALGQLPISTMRDVIEHFSQEVARLQRMADTAFYVCGDQKQSSWLVDQVGALKELASKMGIWNIVHARAVEIYDFRNSGRQGYTLKDGKIVKEEVHGTV